jgi:NAD(P)-dependent dehydrogenase (short-subunit alcohol dehydrogenase family)
MRFVTGFTGRVAVVTGGGSGIGRATAAELAARGARVAVIDIDPAAAAATAELLGPGHLGVRADVASAEETAVAVAEVVEAAGPISILVNAAGIPDDVTPCHELALEQWHQVLATDLTGPFLVSRAVLASMLPLGRGAIVNVASMAGVSAGAGGVAYTAAKHGLVGLTKRMAVDYGPRGIQVNAILPGYVATPMALPYGDYLAETIAATPAGRWCQPEEVAQLIVFLLSDEASYIQGAAYLIDGGATLV